MDFFIARKLTADNFESLTEKVKTELKNEGFGVITEIDIQKTLKEKIDVGFRKYMILGACNPHFAHRALMAEDKIGVLLPCNVVLQETNDGKFEVMAYDPASAMMQMDNQELAELATDVRKKLERIIEKL